MSCILRVSGADLSVDDLSRASKLEPYRIDRKGELRSTSWKRPYTQSGAHFLVSAREFDDLKGQILDATAYLETNDAAIRALLAFPGVEGAVLDFGTEWRDKVTQSDRLPARLLHLAGGLGLDVEISHYPVGEPSAARDAGA